MEELSQSFRALGDPTRLRLLRLLARAPLNVSELVSIVGVAQSSVSHHLSKLRQLGLVREERAAGFTYYSLAVGAEDLHWPLIRLACEVDDDSGDQARLTDLLRQRVDRTALNERLLEPGQSWFLWSSALAALLPALDVADFGCGTGVLSAAIARWARSVVAIDQSAEALSRARARARNVDCCKCTEKCEHKPVGDVTRVNVGPNGCPENVVARWGSALREPGRARAWRVERRKLAQRRTDECVA